jgi:hypothetical protein
LGDRVHVHADLPEDCVLWIPLQRRLVVSAELAKGDMVARKKLYVVFQHSPMRVAQPSEPVVFLPCLVSFSSPPSQLL